MRNLAIGAALLAALAAQAHAADRIKLGFMVSKTGAGGIVGEEQERGLNVALERLGMKLGGLPVTVYSEDDKADPATAVQLASKFTDEDKVDILTGLTGSNTTIPAVPTLIESGVWVVGSLAGPQEFAGKDCIANAFWTTLENEDWDDALALYLDKEGVKSVYFMAADYQAGWEKIGGAMKFYKGKSFGPVYTPWQQQIDLAPEFSQLRAANPEAVLVFYPGGAGTAFVKQFASAGLHGKVKLYAEASLSMDLNFQAQGDAALGIIESTNWSYDLDNPANKEFVALYEKKYQRRPTLFAAMQYDAVNLIDSAVTAVHGKIEDKDAFRAAMYKADFASVRGPFKFDNNHFPIQNIYLTEVVKDADGTMRLALRGVAVKDWTDPYHTQCPMK
ncbi:MAG TPA: ABC transporter substrate-binding protein [Stellaceae bacterium]|nr:ABC transporter substrate-binding protein [Stellaceae bacterium]